MFVSSRVSARLAVAVGLLFALATFVPPAVRASTSKHSAQEVTTDSASSKDIKKAEKEVDKAQQDLAKACRARQRAERKGDQAKLEKYDAMVQRRQCDLSRAQARLDTLRGNTAVARNTVETQTDIAESAPVTPPAEAALPAPEPNIAEPLPPATPAPEQEQSNTSTQSIASNSAPPAPTELPRTAGSLDLYGLIGLLSMGGYFTTLRRR